MSVKEQLRTMITINEAGFTDPLGGAIKGVTTGAGRVVGGVSKALAGIGKGLGKGWEGLINAIAGQRPGSIRKYDIALSKLKADSPEFNREINALHNLAKESAIGQYKKDLSDLHDKHLDRVIDHKIELLHSYKDKAKVKQLTNELSKMSNRIINKENKKIDSHMMSKALQAIRTKSDEDPDLQRRLDRQLKTDIKKIKELEAKTGGKIKPKPKKTINPDIKPIEKKKPVVKPTAKKESIEMKIDNFLNERM
jgi:hypothetical protein